MHNHKWVHRPKSFSLEVSELYGGQINETSAYIISVFLIQLINASLNLIGGKCGSYILIIVCTLPIIYKPGH